MITLKKTLCLVLAVFMLAAVFAGCGGSSSSGSTTTAPPASTSNTTAPPAGTGGSSETQQPPAADDLIDGMYNLAVRSDGSLKYEVDSRGLPTDFYNYEMPISTNKDEVFTFWTSVMTPEMVTEEDYKNMPYQTAMREMTGVNIDYIVVAGSAMSQNFSVLLASDDLPDLLASAYTYYTGAGLQGIEEGQFINFNDYRDYIPNFMHQIPYWEGRGDSDAWDKVFYQDGVIRALGLGTNSPMPASGWFIRADWCERFGIPLDSIVTYDDIHEVLTRFRVEMGDDCYPMSMFTFVEAGTATFASGFNTTANLSTTRMPYLRILDGKACYTFTRQDDYDLLTMYKQWLSEGLIVPDWASTSSWFDLADRIYSNRMGYLHFVPAEIKDVERSTDDPNCKWEALPRPRMYEGQILKYGQGFSGCPRGSNGVAINAKCSNIEVLATWCDFGYSLEGSDWISYGVEGISFYYDENGNKMLTDFILENPDGFATAWLLLIYAHNPFYEPGLQEHLRVYAYPGGEYYVDMMRVTWTEEVYDGSYDWPSVLVVPPELQVEINELSNDVATFVAENYLAFLDGSKPINEWDAYVQNVMNIGMARCEEINTMVYQEYMEKKSSRS